MFRAIVVYYSLKRITSLNIERVALVKKKNHKRFSNSIYPKEDITVLKSGINKG